MSQRPLARVVGNIEFVYAMWERYEISTGAAIDVLKSLTSKCRDVPEPTSDVEREQDNTLKRSVYELVCKLRDTWRAHVEVELANEERVH